jgi:hypothetical protein
MTPGPWRVCNFGEHINGVPVYICDPLGRTVCTLPFPSQEDQRIGSPCTIKAIEQNALAISLLPELVEAARTVLTSAIWDGKSDQYADQLVKRDTLDRLRAVLDKIGG